MDVRWQMSVPFEIDLARDESRVFPPRPLDLTARSLRIAHCRYGDLNALSQFRELRALEIIGFPNSTLESLSQLLELRWLRVLHLPQVTSLAPLRLLSHLRCLSLATSPSWDSSGKVTCVDSLQPIAHLPELQHIELFGVVPADRSLAALETSSSLRTVRVSKYPKSEVIRFRSVTGFADTFMPDASAA
jgi:hypothetical protein